MVQINSSCIRSVGIVKLLLTLLLCYSYTFATSKETREEVYEGLSKLKAEFKDNPQQFVPIVKDVILVATTGNSQEQWQEVNNPATDKGKRSQCVNRVKKNSSKHYMKLKQMIFLKQFGRMMSCERVYLVLFH